MKKKFSPAIFITSILVFSYMTVAKFWATSHLLITHIRSVKHTPVTTNSPSAHSARTA
ncbi:MAG: hypothetical protein JST52_00775 [Bacteroidetes bacterium]|nr:hypothetical protein [Bacteroidota bacterium]MBS1740334.1 hypothetical protein [Bacteroidota bacterium]MBS1776844.1 hypothetical protein [Bacteroidota bacterium]